MGSETTNMAKQPGVTRKEAQEALPVSYTHLLAQNGDSHEENGILYVGSISAERVYPGVRISAAGALPISCLLYTSRCV